MHFLEHILPYKLFSPPTPVVHNPLPSITIASSSDTYPHTNSPSVLPYPGPPNALSSSPQFAPLTVKKSSRTHTKPSWQSDYAMLPPNDPIHYKHVVTQP